MELRLEFRLHHEVVVSSLYCADSNLRDRISMDLVPGFPLAERSRESMIEAFRRGEVVLQGWSVEEEEKLIEWTGVKAGYSR